MGAETVWFYLDMSDEQRGPVARADLLALARQGSLRSDALVWRQGFSAWQPFREVRELQPGAPASTSSLGGPTPLTPTTAAPKPAAVRPGAADAAERTRRAVERLRRSRGRPGLWLAVTVGAVAAAGVVFALAFRGDDRPVRQASLDVVTAAPAEPSPSARAPSASASVTAPVRVRNPFDPAEVFEFPPGTSQAEANDRMAQVLRKRAQERLRR